MKNLTTYLFVMFMAMFWIFRIIVAFCYTIGVNFVTVPMDINYEIVLLFLTFVCMMLVVKRSMLGAILYLIGNGLYFGINLLNILTNYTGTLSLNTAIDLIISAIAIILPVAILIDMILDRNRKANPKDKKTDWFYKGKEYDRKFDERADRNEYKF